MGPPRSAGEARVPAERSGKQQTRNEDSHRYANILFIVTVDVLMHLACSSVLYGGGTNQELAHHCLYQCKGDIMVSTAAFVQLLFMALSRGAVRATLRQGDPASQAVLMRWWQS